MKSRGGLIFEARPKLGPVCNRNVAVTMKSGCKNLPYCIYSGYGMTKKNYSAKLPLTVQLLKRKKKTHLANCYMSSFKLFHLV